MKKLIIFLVLGILLFGCTQYGGSKYGGTLSNNPNNVTPNGTVQNVSAGNGTTKTIEIKNFAFNPGDITVKKGDTVIWVNEDSVPHQIKSEVFPSQSLSNGATFQHTFTEAPGVYKYSCAIHPSMLGSITVTD